MNDAEVAPKRSPWREMLLHGARNDRWLDIWTAGHVLVGAGMGWIMEPFWALSLLILWEPFEILVLSPLLWTFVGKRFGFESWKNSMSDVLADAVGVALGAYLLRSWIAPPTVLFG